MSKVSKLISSILISIALVACTNSTPNHEAFDPEKISKEILEAKVEGLEIPEGASPAEKLLYLLEVNKTLDAMLIATQAEMREVLSFEKTEAEMAEIRNIQEIAREEIQFLIPKLISEFALIYESKFSDEELLTIVEFYQSDVGRKFISSQQELMADGMSIIPSLQKELEVRIEARLAEEK